MFHIIAHQVGHQEEVTIAVVQLHFGGYQVVGVRAQIGGETTFAALFAKFERTPILYEFAALSYETISHLLTATLAIQVIKK